ncbi:MAG: hypothetical protein IPM55_03305 [Acidobacteria bacterium]|nr:hypothetical protein [Acidobacteriota bacterium]
MKQIIRVLITILALTASGLAQQPAEPESRPETPAQEESKQNEGNKRVELNMLGKANTSAGESRRNENVQFNLVDNNALKELNVRLGTTATIQKEFNPANSYFGSEFGNAPRSSITVPAKLRPGFHGRVYETHLNSVFSARTFFQVGEVQPARENDYGFNFSAPLWNRAQLFVEGAQQKIRGMVNGNVLVPRPDERTPLATDPAVRAIVARYLAAYPTELPNRTDINQRALNTNAPQSIDSNQANLRLDQTLSGIDQLTLQYSFTSQSVDAFQFVAGQNPDTDTKSHLARIVWTRSWNAGTVTNFSLSYDRLTSLLVPEENAVGAYVTTAGLTGLGPGGMIPIDRAQNQIRSAALMQTISGSHNWSAGFGLTRRQVNGSETDVHRGFFSFSNDFGRDGITNLRLGTPSTHIVSIGNIHRGFRLWEGQIFAGDKWQISPYFTLNYGLRWQPVTKPVEVNDLNSAPFDSDMNNLAPNLGFALRMPRKMGIFRGAYATQFGEIYFVTFQQIRFSPPGNNKIVVNAPNLINPLSSVDSNGQLPIARPTIYQLDPEMATPYSHQYNLSWEPDWNSAIRVQFGYVGSRSMKLFNMWYLNRAHPVTGIPQTTATINLRRANNDVSDIRTVINASRGYFDAGRVSVIVQNWHGLSFDASYWFSKALDLGSDYTNTANENDSRISRSQYEFENFRDMKGPSSFDQTHAFLWRMNYVIGAVTAFRKARWISRAIGGWNFSTVTLIKTGIPFNVTAGSDGPGFGNVDGNGGDRPNLLDQSILGRTIADPDTSQQLLPRNAFTYINPTDPRGNLGRNVFRKGPIRNVNASLSRVWSIARDATLTFRAESINLFNTPQFAEPGAELANPNFGQITNTLNDGRTFRFLLQLGW